MDVRLYPRLDSRDFVRIDVAIKSVKGKLAKTYNCPKNTDSLANCQLKNKDGVSFDIPLKVIEEIYGYILAVENKIKNNESLVSITKPNPTVRQFVEKHFQNVYLQKRPDEKSRLNTVLNYWQDFLVKDVTSFNIEQYKMDMLKQAASSTVRKYCLLLQQIFRFAVELGYRDKNPFNGVKMPHNKPETERKPISANELPDLFLQLMQADELLFKYCAFLYLTGLRPDDALNLRYSNIQTVDGIECFVVIEGKNEDK